MTIKLRRVMLTHAEEIQEAVMPREESRGRMARADPRDADWPAVAESERTLKSPARSKFEALKHRARRHRRARLGEAQRLPGRARARSARPAAPEPRYGSLAPRSGSDPP